MVTTIRIARELPLPVDAAYAWLTDYREDDPALAHGVLISKRKILSRTQNIIRMEGEHRAFGRVIPSVYEVTLSSAERAWTSRVVEGPRRGSVTTYRLTPRGAGASRLDVEYSLVHDDASGRFILRFARPLVRRNLVRMWDGYESAMRADVGG